MSELTKQALKVDNNQSFPNNNAGLITPTALRTFNENMIDSNVNQGVYTTDSQSFDNRIDQSVVTASLSGDTLTFTKDNGSQFGVQITGASIPAGTISGSQQITALGFVSSSITGSSLVTASFSGNTLTFTKGDSSTFGIVIPDNSGSSIASLNAFTASQELINSGVNAFTASTQIRLTNLELETASLDAEVTSLQVFTQSQQTENTLNQTKWSNLGNQSGSFVTESETGSFATTGSNVFVGNQTITGSLLISGSETIVGELTASRLRVNSSTSLGGTLSVAFDTIMRGDLTIESTSPQIKLRDNGAGGFSSGYDIRVDTGSFEIYDATHNRDVLSDFFNSGSQKHTTSLTSEIIVISGSDSVTLIGNVSASVISASVITGLGSPEGFSASVDSRLDGLEASTSSLFTSASLGLVTASFSGNTLTFTKGDATTFGVVIPDVSGSTINTGSFATTGSNTFVGNQVISGSTTITGELSVTPALLPNGFPAGLGQFIIPFLSGSTNVIARDSDNALYWQPAFNVLAVSSSTANSTMSPGGISLTSGTTGSIQLTTTRITSNFGAGRNITIAGDAESTALTGLTGITNPSIILQSGSAGLPPQYYAPIQFQASQSFTDGRVTITRPLVGLEGAQITGSVDITGTITASLQEGFVLVGNSAGRTTTVATSSFGGGGTDISSLNAFTASQQALNTTFATTGSNTFTGVQTINSTLEIGDGVGTPVQLYATTLTDYNLFVNKDLRLQGTLSASLQEGYVWVGDSTGRTTTVPTSSFGGGGTINTGSLMVTGSVAGNVLTFTKGDASTFVLTVDTGSGGGGAAFPFTGSAEITGSLGITGSMSGFVNTLSVASSTASVNFNDGNMFTLTLPTGSTTHITPSNIRRGQTINIQISQASGASTGSVTFSPNVLFAGGNDYQVTATGSAIDLLTFVSLDGTNVLGTSIKNFL